MVYRPLGGLKFYSNHRVFTYDLKFTYEFARNKTLNQFLFKDNRNYSTQDKKLYQNQR